MRARSLSPALGLPDRCVGRLPNTSGDRHARQLRFPRWTSRRAATADGPCETDQRLPSEAIPRNAPWSWLHQLHALDPSASPVGPDWTDGTNGVQERVKLLATHRQHTARSVVEPSRQEEHPLGLNAIDQTMFLVDASRPVAAELATQSFRLAGALERIPQHGFNEAQCSQSASTVGARPVFGVLQEVRVHDGLPVSRTRFAAGLPHAPASPSL